MTEEPGTKEGVGWLVSPAYLQELMRPISKQLAESILQAARAMPLTPEQHAACRASREAAAAARRVETEAEHAEAVAAAPEVLRPVLDHHSPHVDAWCDYPYCEGCDGDGGHDCEPIAWPCSTYELITVTGSGATGA